MGTPIRKLIYQGPEGLLFGEIEVDGRFFIHSILHDPGSVSGFKACRRVIEALDEELRQLGLTEYYTMADSANGFKFNEKMGFRSNLEVWDDKYEVMVKEL